MAHILGVREFLPSQKAMSMLFGAACVTESAACVGTIASLAGCNPGNINPALYPLYMDYMPSGAAGCGCVHLRQIHRGANPPCPDCDIVCFKQPT